MSASLFLETLKSAHLDHYYGSLSSYGVTSLDKLTLLTMQDYSSIGIVAMEDRKRLFQLIQTLKTGGNPLETMAPPASFNLSKSNYDARSVPNPISFLPKPPPTQPVHQNSAAVAAASYSTGETALSRSLPSRPKRSAHMDEDEENQPELLPESPQEEIAVRQSLSHIHQVAKVKRFEMSNAQKPSWPVDSIMNDDEPATTLDEDVYNNRRSFSSPQPFSKQLNEKKAPLLNAYGIPLATQSSTSKSSVVSKTKEKSDVSSADRIRVCVRKRPLSRKELAKNEQDVAPVISRRTVLINEPKVKVDLTKYTEQHQFTFDEVFDADCTNEQVYMRTAWPLVEYIFTGGKATCFAYGQTGSGKTYTMLDNTQGLYYLACRDIFQKLNEKDYSHLNAHVSFYEIYQGHLYDLLNERKRLFAREDGNGNVVIAGIVDFKVTNADDLVKIFEAGSATRSTGATGANADSSRSHAILQIVLKTRSSKNKIHGKFSFIDLAGSERGADRGDADKQTRMEGSEINKSLLALKECIRALDLDSRHTPFRQSKLTQVLKDSFIGQVDSIAIKTRNSRTCMIATISPNLSNSEHTLNTLRYADRVKELKGESNLEDDVDVEAFNRRQRASEQDSTDDEQVEEMEDEPDLDHHDEVDFLMNEEIPSSHLAVLDEDTHDDILLEKRRSREVLLMEDQEEGSHPYNTRSAQKSTILNQINKTRKQASSTKLPAVARSGASLVSDPSMTMEKDLLDQLVRLHRQSISAFDESSRVEKNLLVGFATRQNEQDQDVEGYVRELDALLEKKMQKMSEVRSIIHKILEQPKYK